MKKITAAVFAALMMVFTGVCASAGVDISAEYAVLIDAATGRVILDRNADGEHPMASTTKIMTAIVALENSDPDDIVTMSQAAAYEEGSSVYLQAGDQMTMRELLYGVMLNSGNDGAAAVAEHIAGSKEAFAEMMNAKAQKLGLEHTHFENPNGLDQDGHYTSAYDLAMLTRYALKNEEFASIVSTYAKKVTILNRPDVDHYFANHNKLLKQYEGCIGVKTGYTQNTGRCLVSAATRYGMTFIAVTLNAPDDWNDHMKMLDYAFNTYVARTVVADGEIITTKNINGIDCDLIAADEISVPVSIYEDSVDTVTELHCERLTAPINEYEKLGYLAVYYNGEEIARTDVIAGCDVPSRDTDTWRTTFFKWVGRIMEKFFKF